MSAQGFCRENKAQRQENARKLRSLLQTIYGLDLIAHSCLSASESATSTRKQEVRFTALLKEATDLISFIEGKAKQLFSEKLGPDWELFRKVLSEVFPCKSLSPDLRWQLTYDLHRVRTQLRLKIQQLFVLDEAPPMHPDLKNGKMLWEIHCGHCHGGEVSRGIDQSSTYFKLSTSATDVYQVFFDRIQNKAHAVARWNKPQDLWDIAFYTLSRGCDDKNMYPEKLKETSSRLSLYLAANFSDSLFYQYYGLQFGVNEKDESDTQVLSKLLLLEKAPVQSKTDACYDRLHPTYAKRQIKNK
jgi:hypothetical protein